MNDVIDLDDFWRIKIRDINGVAIPVDSEDKTITMDVTTENVEIATIDFPKTIYHVDDVINTSNRIAGDCTTCLALQEIAKTKKTFLLPTLREILQI